MERMTGMTGMTGYIQLIPHVGNKLSSGDNPVIPDILYLKSM